MTNAEEGEAAEKPKDETRNNENHHQDSEINNSDKMSMESEKDNSYSSSNLRSHHRPAHQSVSYHGPPPPVPSSTGTGSSQSTSNGNTGSVLQTDNSIDKIFNTGLPDNSWPLSISSGDLPKIISLDVKCEKNSMKVYLAFDKPFYGIVFSKGHYSNVNCVHLPAGLGRTSVNFEIGIHACGTAGNTDTSLYSFAEHGGSGTYFENIVVIQYDPQVRFIFFFYNHKFY